MFDPANTRSRPRLTEPRDADADRSPAPRIAPHRSLRSCEGAVAAEDVPSLVEKYELDPPQVTAVIASMWAKHLERGGLPSPHKKRERKPNSRYDQEAIAYAEADEEDEEEEAAEEEDEEEEVAEAADDASGHDAAGRKHLDDDDDEVSYDEKTGISAEVRVQVTCGDLRGTIVLPAGYKKQQEFVIYPDGRKVPPSQFERDAGKGSSKSWKTSVFVVMPDGSEGRAFRIWMEANGYFPKGTAWDESVVEAARALMGKRKKIAAPAKPVAKKPKSPAAAAPKPKTAAAAAEKEKKPAEKAPEKSIFETQLENLLDDDGGLRLVEKTPNFVWLMRNALKNVERSLVVTVIHRTTDKKCAEAFVKSEGIKVLHEWCAKAKEENKSSLVLKMLKTFRRLPMTVEVLSSTGLGNFVNKLRKYKPPGKEDDDLTNQVVQEAERVKNKWVSVVRAESEAAEKQQAAEKAAAAAAAKRPNKDADDKDASKRRKVVVSSGVAAVATPARGAEEAKPGPGAQGATKRDPKVEGSKPPGPAPGPVPAATRVGVPKPPGASKGVAGSTTTIARTVTTISRPTTSTMSSFGGVNVRGVAAYRKEPTVTGLASRAGTAGSSSVGSASVHGSQAFSKPPKEFFQKSTFAKKKSSKLAAGGRGGIGWRADEELEAVKFFFKDDVVGNAGGQNGVPDPAEERRRLAQEKREAARRDREEEEEVEDEDERAAIEKARERQQKEKAAEQRAANLTRTRRLNEMKAQCRWSRPGRIEYPANWEIYPGKDSEERGRLQSRWKGEFEVKYRSPDQIPESPREAPHHAAYDAPFADPPTMIEVSTRAPPRKDGGQPPAAAHGGHQQFYPPLPGGPPPANSMGVAALGSAAQNGAGGGGGFDQSALQALLQSVQSGALKVPPPQAGHPHGHQPPLPPPGAVYGNGGAPPHPGGPAGIGAGMSSRSYSQGGPPPGLGGGVNHEPWRPDPTTGQKGPMPGGNGLCAFFNTPKGCRWGDACRFRHERGPAPPPGAFPNRRF